MLYPSSSRPNACPAETIREGSPDSMACTSRTAFEATSMSGLSVNEAALDSILLRSPEAAPWAKLMAAFMSLVDSPVSSDAPPTAPVVAPAVRAAVRTLPKSPVVIALGRAPAPARTAAVAASAKTWLPVEARTSAPTEFAKEPAPAVMPPPRPPVTAPLRISSRSPPAIAACPPPSIAPAPAPPMIPPPSCAARPGARKPAPIAKASCRALPASLLEPQTGIKRPSAVATRDTLPLPSAVQATCAPGSNLAWLISVMPCWIKRRAKSSATYGRSRPPISA